MPDNIIIKKVTVADPEVGFKIKVDKAALGQPYAGVSFCLHLEEGGKEYESEMHIGRTVKYGVAQYEEIENDEFDVIIPFVDPHYAAGQTFKYKLKVSFCDMQMKVFHEETIDGTDHVLSDSRFLEYKIVNGTLDYKYVAKTFQRPPKGTLNIFDPVVGKAGLGLRISWGEDLDVWKIRLMGGFEDGKATINTWLNTNLKYKPKYLPLTIFAPYPRGANYKNGFQYSFSVELFNQKNERIGFKYHTDIPWSPDQKLKA